MESQKFLNKQNILKLVFESILIIFSVLLALFLNEYRGHLKENQLKHQALQMVAIELEANYKTLSAWHPYHAQVLENLNRALDNDSLQKSLITKNGVLFWSMMPRGVMQRLVDNASWQTLKSSFMYSTIEFNTLLTLSKLYKLQTTGVESTINNIFGILSSRESMAEENLKSTLVLLHNAFNELVNQEIFLIKKYDETVIELEIPN